MHGERKVVGRKQKNDGEYLVVPAVNPVVFFAARKLAVRFKMPLLNPLLVAMVVIIPFCCSPAFLMSVTSPGARSLTICCSLPWWRWRFLYMSNCIRSARAGNPS